MEKKLEASTKGALTAEERAAAAAKALAEEEEEVKELERELGRTREVHFRKKQVTVVKLKRKRNRYLNLSGLKKSSTLNSELMLNPK